MNRAVWISWERQRRNRELAAALGVALHEWPDIDADPKRVRKYATGVGRTLRLLLRIRPTIVFCQNPSIVLASLVLALRPLLGCRVVVDAHNAGLFPLEGRSRVLLRLARALQRRADVTIVTNPDLADIVRGNGGRPFVLPDRVPELTLPAAARGQGRTILFVCSYGSDEPFDAVFRAAGLLPPDVIVNVTGNYQKAGIDPARLPSNVRLTGYVAEADYLALLTSACAVMDLTTRESCLVCGAYEAVAAGRPMILSDTRANRRYFSRGCVYTTHEPAAIAAAVLAALENGEHLADEVRSLKVERCREWAALRSALLCDLASL